MTTPVIIVPGILGTRLVNSTGRSIWDPDEGWTFDNGRGLLQLRDMRNAARPNPRAKPAVERLLRHRGVVNGGNLVWDRGYGNLVTVLSGPRFAAICGGRVKLYCAGYDWRQSNIDSARRLRLVVERALRETGARRVVLVAHSMGGLVSRLFCRFSRIGGRPGSDVVARLILLGSPVHGASKAYRVLRQSLVEADSSELLSDIQLDETTEGAVGAFAGRALASLARRIPSAYELLPTRAFCSANPGWLQFDHRRAGLTNAADPARVYRNRVTGIDGDPALLRMRDGLDRGLGSYVPAQSVVLYSSQLPTETHFRIDRSGNLRRHGSAVANRGDGTVPVFSGSAAASRTSSLVREDLRSVDHGGLANSPVAIARIQHYLAALCRPAAAPEVSRAIGF
ncbi:esterase/lipase family protein [Microbulbifer sp. TYP-18]|uniref:esterase/lipase family protein n=1 Tax=Microbulbifer sp. TYP-18 TaxID=3230024 RepID=UPI0034C5E167